jgi:hypothetical protein
MMESRTGVWVSQTSSGMVARFAEMEVEAASEDFSDSSWLCVGDGGGGNGEQEARRAETSAVALAHHSGCPPRNVISHEAREVKFGPRVECVIEIDLPVVPVDRAPAIKRPMINWEGV